MDHIGIKESRTICTIYTQKKVSSRLALIFIRIYFYVVIIFLFKHVVEFLLLIHTKGGILSMRFCKNYWAILVRRSAASQIYKGPLYSSY